MSFGGHLREAPQSRKQREQSGERMKIALWGNYTSFDMGKPFWACEFQAENSLRETFLGASVSWKGSVWPVLSMLVNWDFSQRDSQIKDIYKEFLTHLPSLCHEKFWFIINWVLLLKRENKTIISLVTSLVNFLEFAIESTSPMWYICSKKENPLPLVSGGLLRKATRCTFLP